MPRTGPAARVTAALILLAACGEEDRTPMTYTPSNDKIALSSDDLSPPLVPVAAEVPDTAVPHPVSATVAVALAPLGNETLAGAVRLIASGGATSVRTGLVGGKAGITYAGSIRHGECRKTGSTVASLVPVTADAAGVGRSTSDVPVPLDSLSKVPHVLVYGPGGRSETCGSIPVGRPGSAAMTTTPSGRALDDASGADTLATAADTPR